MEPREQVSASKKLGADEALELARKASRVVVAKGKKVTTFDMRKDRPTDEDLLAHLLGPTGNLRAPTVVAGKLLIVGFNDEEYTAAFT